MNYFEFFDLPYTISVDEVKLKQRFYQNSKKFHPDFFSLTDVEQQMKALEQSTLNNKAYNTLKDFDKRIQYILSIEEILKEEGNNNIPQDFLLEMMEINEAVMELQFEFEKEKLNSISSEIERLKSNLAESINEFLEKEISIFSEEEKELLKNYYLKTKYLNRLVENINKIQVSG